MQNGVNFLKGNYNEMAFEVLVRDNAYVKFDYQRQIDRLNLFPCAVFLSENSTVPEMNPQVIKQALINEEYVWVEYRGNRIPLARLHISHINGPFKLEREITFTSCTASIRWKVSEEMLKKAFEKEYGDAIPQLELQRRFGALPALPKEQRKNFRNVVKNYRYNGSQNKDEIIVLREGKEIKY